MMLNLITCQSQFHCLETYIGGILSFICSVMLCTAYWKIYKNENSLLDPQDKQMVLISVMQIIIITLYYLIYSSAFLIYCFKFLRIFLDLMLINIILAHSLDESMRDSLEKCHKFSALFNILLWFYQFFTMRNEFPCGQNHWQIYDIVILTTSLIILISAIKSLKQIQINLSFQEQREFINEDPYTQSIIEDSKNRRMQVTILSLSSFCSSLLMYIIEFIIYVKNYPTTPATDIKISIPNEININNTLNTTNTNIYNTYGNDIYLDCTNILQNLSILGGILFIASTFVAYNAQIWGIYYIFYWKNKDVYELTVNLKERLGSLFHEKRSMVEDIHNVEMTPRSNASSY